MNKTINLLTARASCRAFRKKRVPQRTLELLLEAGRLAPTGGNLQPYSVIVAEKESSRRRFAELCGQPFLAKAPVHFVYCVDLHRQKRWARLERAPYSADRSLRPFWIAFQDTVICAQNMCVAADALGLGSVYIGPVFDKMAEIRELCRLPKAVIPVVLLAAGYPAAKPPRRRKLPAGILAHRETYRDPPDEELLGAYAEKYAGVSQRADAKKLRVFYRACLAAEGPARARRWLAEVKARGVFTPPQIIFGLHYRADDMLRKTPGQLRMLKAAGLGWPSRAAGGKP